MTGAGVYQKLLQDSGPETREVLVGCCALASPLPAWGWGGLFASTQGKAFGKKRGLNN